jgi:hypothetical protein
MMTDNQWTDRVWRDLTINLPTNTTILMINTDKDTISIITKTITREVVPGPNLTIMIATTNKNIFMIVTRGIFYLL